MMRDNASVFPGGYALVAGESGVRTIGYPIGDLRRYGWTGAADETTSFSNAATSVRVVGTNVITLPPGITTIDNVSLTNATTLIIRGQGIGVSTLRQKAAATGPALSTVAGVTLLIMDTTIDGNFVNHAQPTMLDLTQGSANYDFIRCDFRGWRQFGVKLHNVNGVVNFTDCTYGDAKCGGNTSALTSYAVYLGADFTNNGKISFTRPVAKQTTQPIANEFLPSFVLVAASEGDTLTLQLMEPDLTSYGANPADGASGVIDCYQFVSAFRLMGGWIRNSGVAAVKMGNCSNFDIAGVVIDGDTAANNAAAISHNGYARPPIASTYNNGRIAATVLNWSREYAVALFGDGSADNKTPRRYFVDLIATACKAGVFLDGVGDVDIHPQIHGCTGAGATYVGVHVRNCRGFIKVHDGFIRGGASYGVYGDTGLTNANIAIKGVTFDTNTTHHIRFFDAANTIPLIRISDCEFVGATPTALLQAVTRVDERDNYAAQGAPATAAIGTLSSIGNSWDP